MAKKKKKVAKKKTAKKAKPKKAAAKKATAKKTKSHMAGETHEDAIIGHEHGHEEGVDHEVVTGVGKEDFGKEESEFENFDDDDDYGTPATEEEEPSDDEAYF